MPAKSGTQKRLMCMAIAVKTGKLSKSFSQRVTTLASQMTLAELQDY